MFAVKRTLDGIPDDWLDAAQRSPVYALAHRYRVALPLHPEYRTLPMVWYVPPLSPIINTLETDGYEADPDDVFGAIEAMRIPLDYLANLLAAGDSEVIRDVLRRLAAMRGHMRKREVLGEHDEQIAAAAGMSVEDVEDMYRLLAIGKYEQRYVIPKAHAELAGRLLEQQGACGLDFEGGPGNCGMIADPTPDYGRFMLTDEPAQLDIVQIAERRDGDATMRRRGQAERATVYKLCSLALQYPDAELLAGREQLAGAVARLADEPPAVSLRQFFAWFTTTSPLELTQRYVQSFDLAQALRSCTSRSIRS